MPLTNALRLAVGTTDTTLQLVSVNEFPTNGGVVTIDTEQISYSTATDYSLIGCFRGFNSTVAAPHVINSLITLNIPVPPVGLDMEGERIVNLADPVNDQDAATKDYVDDSSGGSGITQLTGDVTAGPGSGSQPATLAASGVTAGAYTNANVTVDAKGRVTTATSGTSGANTALSNLTTTSVNASIIPASNGVINLGSLTDTWNSIFARSIATDQATLSLVTNSGVSAGNYVFNTSSTSEVRLTNANSGGGLFIFSNPTYSKGSFGVNDGGPGSSGLFQFSSTGFMTTIEFESTSGGASISDTVVNHHDTSAVLDLQSTSKGFLPPRMTTPQRNAISTPAEGLMVYDLTLHHPFYYNGTSWVQI